MNCHPCSVINDLFNGCEIKLNSQVSNVNPVQRLIVTNPQKTTPNYLSNSQGLYTPMKSGDTVVVTSGNVSSINSIPFAPTTIDMFYDILFSSTNEMVNKIIGADIENINGKNYISLPPGEYVMQFTFNIASIQNFISSTVGFIAQFGNITNQSNDFLDPSGNVVTQIQPNKQINYNTSTNINYSTNTLVSSLLLSSDNYGVFSLFKLSYSIKNNSTIKFIPHFNVTFDTFKIQSTITNGTYNLTQDVPLIFTNGNTIEITKVL